MEPTAKTLTVTVETKLIEKPNPANDCAGCWFFENARTACYSLDCFKKIFVRTSNPAKTTVWSNDNEQN